MSHRSQEHPAIEISGLSKGFGRTAVLRGLDLQVEWGEVLTVLGPNGSGKTTLIRVLATLARPDEGDVHVAGADLSRMGKYVRSITGVVTHEPLLYGDMTGHENLKFVGRMFGLDNVDDRDSLCRGPARNHLKAASASWHPLTRPAEALQHRPCAPTRPSGVAHGRA